MSKVIDEVVLKKAITEVLQVVADNTFDFVEYESDEINALFDVESPEKLAYYESLINPDLVSENRLWSSKTIADKIAEAIVESNSYADGLITNITSIQLEWCSTSLPVTGETNKIYILPVTSGSDTVNTLNIWNSKTSAYVSIGNLEIDLSQYYTKSEIDTKLNDKANKSEVLSQDGVLTTTGTETNDNVYSSKLTKTELDKKANNDEVVKKTDIVTSINSSSADDKVPSAKAVFTPIDKIQSSLTSLTPVLDLNNFKGKTFMIGRGTGYNNECANVPNGVTGAFVVEYFPYYDGELYGVQRLTLVQAFGGKYITFERSLDNGNWMGWQRVCTTSVTDVPKTNITITDETNYKNSPSCDSFYVVKNGTCYVTLAIDCITPASDTIVANLPPTYGVVRFSMSRVDGSMNGYILPSGTLKISGGVANTRYYVVSFSYPVAES